MNTRNRPQRMRQAAAAAPVGMAMRAAPAAVPSWPQRHSFCPPGMGADSSGECVSNLCVPRAHPLADPTRNARLADYEHAVRARFDAIVPTLKQIAALQHEEGFEQRAQQIARERLGFELPAAVLADAWVTTLDMRKLYGASVLRAFRDLANDCAAQWRQGAAEAQAMTQFFIECGFHEVDVSACADGRLKGLLQYILRLPKQAVRRHKSYAGTLFDVEANVKQWTETELRRFREGVPTLADAGTRYLKIAVYHFSSSDPHHEGCAAHGSDERRAAQAALDRLQAFGTAIENGFCCGASVATLLIGVDTDNDAIRVHVPDAQGEMSLDCLVDNMALYQATAERSESEARWRLGAIVEETARLHGRSAPDTGMRRLIERLLLNNLSQIDYVCDNHRGRYADVGHAERFISIGDGFEEVHLRNLAYFGHMHTVEEGAADMDVGIRIFTGLNVAHGLPVPVAIHYRYDSQVPGSRERSVERCHRVKAAIEARYPALVKQGLLFCGMSVQAKEPGSALETVADNELNVHGH
ncbi:MAG: carboxysome shell carbonic anhydrase [Betaproteobacteria bacterium]|nr:carboxysome shell carbonic anhydrase [Betaproteobacteria bacterium]